MKRPWKLLATIVASASLLTSVGCGPTADSRHQPSRGKAEAGGEAPNPLDGLLDAQYTPIAAEYQLLRGNNDDVLKGRQTEIWAKVLLPSTNGADEPPKLDDNRPVLLFLHGNHATCGSDTLTASASCSPALGGSCRSDRSCAYTSYGECPAGQVVVNNHHGYDYVGRQLARQGYVVVSINANLGITCARGIAGDGGLNLARGRLVLKHLEILAAWNNDADGDFGDSFFPLPANTSEIAGVPVNDPTLLGALAGKLDLTHVGMMGHSRGGEGVRAAYAQYVENSDGTGAVDEGGFELGGQTWAQKIAEPVSFKGILEIGPVDGQTSRTVDAFGTPWAVILPMCDGDVSNLQGMKPFDRMLADPAGDLLGAPKSMLAVWGANHNFFNTEWQTSDANTCTGPGHEKVFMSESLDESIDAELPPLIDQQKIGLAAMLSFFRANVGGAGTPAAELGRNFDPFYAISQYFTGLSSYERSFADSSLAGETVVLREFTSDDEDAKKVSEHDGALRAIKIDWNRRDDEGELLTESPSHVLGWAATDLGEGSKMTTLSFRLSRHASDKTEGPSDLSIVLLDADGNESQPLSLSAYATLLPPVGGAYGVHYILQTVRIPLADFADVALDKVTGLKLVFDATEQGSIYLASVRASRRAASLVNQPVNAPVNLPVNLPVNGGEEPFEPPTNAGDNVVVTDDPGNGRDPGQFAELRFESQRAFWVGGSLPVLEIGKYRFFTGGYPGKDDVGLRIDVTDPAADPQAVRQLHNLNNILFRVPLEAAIVEGGQWPGFYQVDGDLDVRIVYGAARGQRQVSWSFGKLSDWRRR